jgi:predicted O-methyltransferase YrrM
VSGKLFQLKSFFNYWLDAVDEHSLHSPFLFNFYSKVIKQKVSDDFDSLRAIRKRFLHDDRIVHVTDLGAGPAYLNANRKISDIVRITGTPDKFSSLYARIIRYHGFKHVIELGTSIGINAMYLAKANENVELTTFEGAPEMAAIARELFNLGNVDNIRLLEGNIDITLEPYLSAAQRIDFALVDANHRFEPTLQYLEQLIQKTDAHSVIAIDDIHHSPEMERAWQTIQNNPRVQITIDLYRCGLIFFNPSLTRQNVVLQF